MIPGGSGLNLLNGNGINSPENPSSPQNQTFPSLNVTDPDSVYSDASQTARLVGLNQPVIGEHNQIKSETNLSHWTEKNMGLRFCSID